jgi:orotate phosphoribosyltransferase
VLGQQLAAAVSEHEPEAELLAAPVVGAITLAAAASLETGLPFVIVRDEAKPYGTANRVEGAYEQGNRVCLIEDVVTSGGAVCDAVVALRHEGLVCRTAVCVVDREEGGVDAVARQAVRLRPLFKVSEIAEKPHG